MKCEAFTNAFKKDVEIVSKRFFYSLTGLLFLSLAFSCQKDISRENQQSRRNSSGTSTTNSITAATISLCGTPQVQDLGNTLGNFASVTVSNDANNVYLNFSAASGFQLQKASGLIGDYAHLQSVLNVSPDPTVGPNPPDFAQTFSPEVASYQFAISRANLANCFLINAFAAVVKKDGTGAVVETEYVSVIASNNITSYPFSTYFEYCLQDCPPPPGDCGQLRTETPGGWGAKPAGNNPGTYLHANFAAAFPSGLTVGCSPSNNVLLTTAQAITDLLPTGGTPAALTSNYTNPASLKNELVGQVVALSLSVGFDDYDPGFGQAGIGLGDMKIGSGAFAGWTVRNFLAEANKVLGGCDATYTPQQIEDIIDKINKNYDDGTVNLGFLVCPQ